MNKIFKVKRNSRGQSVVCSEIAKSKTKGRVIASALAVAVAGLMSTVTAQAAATVGDSGTYSAVLLDVVAQGGAYSDSTIGAVAIGSNLKYTDAYGRQASTEATAPLSIAIGVGATARAVDGVPADSTNPDDPNFAQPLAAIAVGTSATANGYTSTAIGYRSSAIDRSSSAFGVQANAENFMATALGSGATSTGFTSTSVGANAEATGRNAVSVGTSRHTDGLVASGEQGILLGASDIEGLTAEQLQGVRYADDASPWSSFDGSNLSEPAKATGESRTAIVSGKNALGVGVAVKATGERAIAEGYYASASGTDSVAFGSNANATQTNAMALGTNTVVTAKNSTALGGLNTITTANTFAFGSNITTSIGKDVILGTDSASYLAGAQTSGRDAYTSYEIDGTTYNFAGVTPNNVVSVGAIGKEGRIQNVAAGLISATSTDAINGSQLYAVTQSLEELAAKPDLDTNTDKSVRVSSTSPLLTISNTAGTADGITEMTDYSISLSDQVATKTFVTEEIAKIDTPVDTDKSVRLTSNSPLLTVSNAAGAKDGITDMTDYTISLNTDLLPKTVVAKGTGTTVTSSKDGDTTTYTVSVDDTIADKQFVADEIAKIPVVTDTNTDKSVRVASSSELLTVSNTAGTADGITNMTDYTIALSDKVATKDFVTEEIAKIQLPVDTDTNSISKVEQGNGVTVTSVVNGDTTTFTVAVDDTIANKQFVTEEIAKIKMPEFTDTNTVSEVAAGEGILVDAVTEGDKTTYTVSLDKTKLPSILDTNTDKSVRVISDSDLITVTSAEGTADGITTMTDYTISVSDKVATKDYVDSKLPVVEAGDNVVVKTNTVDGKSIYTVSANSSSVTKGDGIAVEMTETTATNGAVNRDYKVSLDDATKAQLAKEESVVAKAGQTNIKVTQPRTNGTGGNEFEVDLASDLTNINSIANGDTKLSLGDAQVNVNGATITNVASPVNATDAVNKQYVDDSKPTISEGYGITVTETPTTKGAATSIDYNVALNEKTKQTLDQVAVNTGNINKGINTRTEDDQVVNHKLGDTISVVGDNKNITTATTDNGAISVKMADDIKVDSVSINNTGITMGGHGIHAGDMKVTGVAPGVISPSSTDAVNGSQLFATNVAIADNRRMINELGDQVNNRMDNMQDEYRAGIADAAAIAGLPEIHLTGKSMIAVAGSTFKGESALAIGFSSLSDNSRIKFKATGSVNTQGDFLGTVGAGWAF